MANSKIFRSAQNRSAGKGQIKDGYFNFNGAIQNIKKTQIRNCQPYNFMRQIAKKINAKTSDIYAKIIFSNVRGAIKMIVSVGKNKDQAASSSNSYMVIGNVLQNKVQTVVKLNKNASAEATDQKNKKTKDSPSIKSSASRSSRKKSVKFRKRTRRISRRARLRRRNRVRLKNQLVIKDFEEAGLPQPAALNDTSAAAPAKDFASIFEDSNNKLYDEESQSDIKVDNPPGVAKFIGMGVDTDRPSVIASTELSPIVFDDTLDVFSQVLLDRRFRVETIFNNLEKVGSEDIEKMLETLQEFKLLTADAVQATSVISLLDDQLVKEISVEMSDLASVLGFSTAFSNSQLYSQVISDLSIAPWLGTYKTENGDRNLSLKSNEINYDSFYRYNDFTGGDIYNDCLKSGGTKKSAADPASYMFGNTGTLLGFYDTVDPSAFKKSASVNPGRSGISAEFELTDSLPMLMQAIYFELMMSRLIGISDSVALSIQEHGHKKIASAFLGNFKDPTVPLNEISVPEGLAAIIKFKSGGENYYPLEQFISSASGISGRTFLDAVVQPAVGSIIEDQDPNFDLLNSWIESSQTSLDSYFRYTDAATLDGGAAIVFNEIILATIKCIADPNAKIGNKKHPHSNRMELKNSDLEGQQIANILNIGMQRFAKNSTAALPHVYNTMGYCFFEGQGELVTRIGRYSGFGLYNSNIINEVNSYNINYGDWNRHTSRSPSDGEPTSEVLNNIYEEFSRFFGLLENNLMTSIDLALSDLGLLTLTNRPDYNTAANGYFDNKTPTVKKSALLSSTERSQLGTYEATKFSGLPRLYLRHLLAKCAWSVYWYQGNAGWPNRRQDVIKAAKVAVENLDESLGPVRYKVTHGQWPLDSDDFDDLSSADYESLVPSEVREALEGNVEVDVDTDEDGNVESINVSDPSEGWDFVNSTEGFCPLTLMLDGEDNSDSNLSLVRANRAIFDNFYDKLIQYRTSVYKLKSFLQRPIDAYMAFPETLEESVGSISLDSLKELAQLPGIDGQELVKFTSENQIGNLNLSLKIEDGSSELRYIPNKFIISENEFMVAKKFVDTYLESKFSDQSKAVVQSIGLPTGLLSSMNLSENVFSLTRDAEYMFYSSYSWSSKLNLYHPAIYLIPGSFTNCDPDSSFDTIVQNAKYFISNKTTSNFMSYSEVLDFLDLTESDSVQVLTNHCLSHCLSLVLKITTGMNFSEDTFRINSDANNLFVSEDGQKNIETLLTTVPDSFDQIFSEDGIVSPHSLSSTLSESTSLEINTYLGSLECRLITPEEICKKVLSPRVFDRVLCLFCHPDEHYTERSGPGLKRLEKTIDGSTKTVYQINLQDAGDNSVRNDHFASYYYKVEQK